MKNKKILILANLDVGLYKFRKALIKKLIDQGNEVYISLPKGMLVQNLKEMGCHFIETPVDRRGINPATDLKLMMRYFNILGKIKPDLVHHLHDQTKHLRRDRSKIQKNSICS